MTDDARAPRADEMDPQATAVVEGVVREGFPGWRALGVEAGRRFEDDVFSGPPTPEIAHVEDRTIDRPGRADADLPVRIYRPAPDERRPVVVHLHGGGFVLGTLDSVDGICRELADRTGCVVVSVDYRLAPEHPYPAAIDDACAALEWVAAHPDAVGGDGTVAVSGTSAGGGLAAACALRAAWNGEQNGEQSPEQDIAPPAIAHQCLLYPMLDTDRTRTSYGDAACAWLTGEDVAWFWEQYLASSADVGVDDPPADAAPTRAAESELAAVAPATVVTAGFDPLRDEGAAYVERLRATGSDASHRHYPDQPHGFLSLTADVDAADTAMDDLAADLRAALR